MSELKCPFCQQRLLQEYNRQRDAVIYHCTHCYFQGDGILWQELIRTRKALDVAVDAIKSAKARLELINNSKFANLNNVLQIQSQCEILKIEKSLEQITALEQKD